MGRTQEHALQRAAGVKLTGPRRGIEIVLWVSVAWVGAIVVWARQMDGYVIHRMAGDPVRYWQVHRSAGNGLSDIIGVVALVTAGCALARGTERAAVFAMLVLFGLAPLCWIELTIVDDLALFYEVYDPRLVERRWPAVLVTDATRLLAWSSFVLTPVLAALHLLERRKKRAAIPRAVVIP